jgi:hypothetical protein
MGSLGAQWGYLLAVLAQALLAAWGLRDVLWAGATAAPLPLADASPPRKASA